MVGILHKTALNRNFNFLSLFKDGSMFYIVTREKPEFLKLCGCFYTFFCSLLCSITPVSFAFYNI